MIFLTVWLPTIIVFALLLGLLILFHELGHFLAAKKAGMKVEEFGFGFPPKIWSKRKGDTLYSINLIPIGGFVKILGENEDSDSKQAFANKSIGSRLLVIVAGVLMNFVLAYIAILIVFWSALPPIVSSSEAYGGKVSEGSGGLYIETISEDSLALKNDIRKGDLIFEIGGIKDPSVVDLRNKIAENKNGNVVFKIKRGEENIEKTIEVGESPVLGVGILQRLGKVHYSWWKVPWFALEETAKAIVSIALAILVFLKGLIVSGVVPGEVLGPVGIFGITSVAVQLGFAYVLNLLIILTINLGIINILPFPALDGGRLVFLLAEKIRGRKIAQKVEVAIHNIGFLILIILIILVTWRDIVRF